MRRRSKAKARFHTETLSSGRRFNFLNFHNSIAGRTGPSGPRGLCSGPDIPPQIQEAVKVLTGAFNKSFTCTNLETSGMSGTEKHPLLLLALASRGEPISEMLSFSARVSAVFCRIADLVRYWWSLGYIVISLKTAAASRQLHREYRSSLTLFRFR